MSFDMYTWFVAAVAAVIEYGILHPDQVMGVVLGALGVGLLCILVGLSLRNGPKKGRIKMGKKQRKLHVAEKGADWVLDGLSRGYAAGDFTRDEVNKLYKNIAHSTGLWDLIPRRVVVYPDQATLKAELLARKAERETKTAKVATTTVVTVERKLSMREMLLGKHA